MPIYVRFGQKLQLNWIKSLFVHNNVDKASRIELFKVIMRYNGKWMGKITLKFKSNSPE